MKSRMGKTIFVTGACVVAMCAPLLADQSAQPAEKTEPKLKDAAVKQVDSESCEPTLKLPEALKIADAYLKEEQIDLSGHFLESVRLTDVEGKLGSYWKLTWIPKKPSIGGEIWVYVSMDRRLNPTIERGR